MSDKLRSVESVEYDPEERVLGKLHSGETVIGNLFDPEINIPDSDFLKEAGFIRSELIFSILSWVNASGQGYDGYDIVGSHEFDDILGTNDCMKTSPGDEIIYAFRPSRKRRRKQPTRYVLAREGTPTRRATVILRRNENNPNEVILIAAWIGEPANPEPVGPKHNTLKNRRFWRGHALVLRELGQIDTNRPVYRSYNGRQGQQISIKELDDLVEEEERKFAVGKTIEHMRAGQFGSRYEDIYSEPARRKLLLEIRGEKIAERARKLAENQIEAFAASCLAIVLQKAIANDDVTGRILGAVSMFAEKKTRKWKKLVHRTGRQETDGTILANRITKANMAEARTTEILTAASMKLLVELENAEEEARQEVRCLLKEMEAQKDDPAFIEAARSWTNAPDSDGLIGQSGRGFSGGLVHFFEYRSGLTKRERFKTIDEPMTVQGFIDFTKRLLVEVTKAETLLNAKTLGESENYVVVLGDSRSNKRFYILRPNNDLILAYQKPNQTIKLSTMVTNSSKAYVDRVAKESLWGEDRGRLNKLGPRVYCIMCLPPSKASTEELTI